MSRLVRAAAAVTASVLLLTGCAATAGSTTVGEESSDGLSGRLDVYAAASLADVFDEIGAAFEAAHPGVEVALVLDGSSTLATQIEEGAPADVFASANEANMDRVADLVVDPALFATNTLVVAMPAGNPGGVAELADLADVTTVLCAVEVPCGAASATLLDNAGVDVTPASEEQNVTAVLSKVATGEADAGLVYATDVQGAEGVESFVPEGADEVVNRYPIAAVAGASESAAAEAFVAFVQGDEARAILAAAGFGAP